MIDAEAFALLRAEFVRRAEKVSEADVEHAWRDAVRLLDMAAQPRRYVTGLVEGPSYGGEP